MAGKRRPVPVSKTEIDERAFRESHDSSDYVDWSKAERVRFPGLGPSTRAISIRLPADSLEQIEIATSARDVPLSVADQGPAGREGRHRLTQRPNGDGECC